MIDLHPEHVRRVSGEWSERAQTVHISSRAALISKDACQLYIVPSSLAQILHSLCWRVCNGCESPLRKRRIRKFHPFLTYFSSPPLLIRKGPFARRVSGPEDHLLCTVQSRCLLSPANVRVLMMLQCVSPIYSKSRTREIETATTH